MALGRGPTGATLDLRHEQRAQSSSMDEIGRLLTNICQAVPQVCHTLPILPTPARCSLEFHNMPDAR